MAGRLAAALSMTWQDIAGGDLGKGGAAATLCFYWDFDALGRLAWEEFAAGREKFPGES
jgi:hypothetical protein